MNMHLSAATLLMFIGRTMTVTRMILCFALIAPSLAGCGVRGSLELPPAAKAKQAQTAQADSGQGKPAGAAPKPHKTFILDGLLR